MIRKLLLLLFCFAFFSNTLCLRLWIVSSKHRKTEETREVKTYQRTKSFAKAKQWLEYKLIPEGSKIEKEDLEAGSLSGVGLIRCYVPYGIGEIDANEHEFNYKIYLRDGSATFTVERIFSFIKDPNDIVLNYGPKNERVAKITIRSCFKPLFDDFFDYIK